MLLVSTLIKSFPSDKESEAEADVNVSSILSAVTSVELSYCTDKTAITLPFWNCESDTSLMPGLVAGVLTST